MGVVGQRRQSKGYVSDTHGYPFSFRSHECWYQTQRKQSKRMDLGTLQECCLSMRVARAFHRARVLTRTGTGRSTH